MTMGHLLRLLFIIGLAIQLCDGTCYWSKPSQKKTSISSSSSSASSTTFGSSSKLDVLNSQNKITDLSTRLNNIGVHSEEDSSEYNDDSSEDLFYRDHKSTRKLQNFVTSRALSKKIQKSIKKVTTNQLTNKKALPVVPVIPRSAITDRFVNNGFPRSYQQISSTATRSSTNVVGVAGNIFLSVPEGYVANTVSTTITRLLTEQEAIRLGLLNAVSISGSETTSSYQTGTGLNSLGNTVGRSIVNNIFARNTANTNGYYQNSNSQLNTNGLYNLKNTGTTVGLDNIAAVQQRLNHYKSINNNLVSNNINNESYQKRQHSVGRSYDLNNIDGSQRVNQLKTSVTGENFGKVSDIDYNQIHQNTAAAGNYRNVETSGQLNQYTTKNINNHNINYDNNVNKGVLNQLYQSDVVKNNRVNFVNQNTNDHQINHVLQKSLLKHIQKIGTKIGETLKSYQSNKLDVTKSFDDTNDDDNNKLKSQVLNQGKSVYSHSTKVEHSTTKNIKNASGKTFNNDVDTVSHNVNNDTNQNTDYSKNIKSTHKQTINVTQKRSMDVNQVASKINTNSNSEKIDVGKNSNSKVNEDDDSGEDDDQLEDKISVYEYLNTFHKFKFDSGLNAVGLIGEVLKQLDYQRYKLLDDIIYPQDATHYVTDGEEFDFIVVGGGNAGCVLANKLSENINWKVLLIEAGGDALPITQIPGLWDRSLNSFTDWQYKIEPDSTTGFGIEGNMKLHKGMCLGGSSTLSAQLYVRGSEKVYNSLVQKGLTDWSYNTTEKYFKKMEKVRSITKTETNTTIYGKCGLVPVSSFRKTGVTVLENIVRSGFEYIGCEKQRDINHKDIEVGFVSMQGTIKNGRSIHTAKAYLSSVFGRQNLKVMKYARVTKVVTDKISMKALGVEIQTKFGQTLTIKSRKEVLLCAGAVGSPKILMASGIGPKKHLSEIGVPVVKNLPVGEKFLIAPVFTGFVISYDKPVVGNLTDEEIAFKYLARNTGPLSTPKGMSFGGFLNTGTSGSFADVEVHQFYIPENSPSKLCQLKSMYGFSDNLLTAYSKLNANRAISVFTIALINTKSTGKILLRSKNPLHKPIIVGNMLTHKDDVKTLLEAIKLLTKIEKSEEMKLVDATLESIDIDGCAKYDSNTDEHWECLLKYMVSTTSSTAGSCRMGLESDQDAVVDSKLNVIGVSNLRVVGRSVLPMITSAYSHIPCIMIAERAYDMIHSKYNN